MNKNYVEINILTKYSCQDTKKEFQETTSYLYKVGDKIPTLKELKMKTRKVFKNKGLIKEMKAFLKLYVGYTREEVKEFNE